MAEFKAKYSTGMCPNGDRILEGQEVMYVDQELWHVECVSQSGASRPGGEDPPGKWDGTDDASMGF